MTTVAAPVVPLDSTNEREHRGQLAAAVNRLLRPRASFMAYLSATTANNKTGNAVNYDVAFDAEDFDTNNNFAGSVFTAPETGKYRFSASVVAQNVGAAHTYMELRLICSGGQTITLFYAGSYNRSDAGYVSAGGATTVSMIAGETAKLRVAIGGGTQVVGILGGHNPTYTHFSGERIG